MDKDKDDEKKACESFTLHPIRKQCKTCRKPSEDHPFTEDDVDNMRRYLKVFSEHPEIKPHPKYAWIPANCPTNRIDEYFEKFPENKIPKHKSKGQEDRLKRLAYQIPLSDVSLEKCRFLDPKYQAEFQEFADKLQNTILRLGKVNEWAHGMPIQCPNCLLVLDPSELVVTSFDNGSKAFHPACFVCFQCREHLADLIHCSDIDGTIFCLRHYSDIMKRRCHTCDELIFASKFASAGNKFYHKEHLLCFSCDGVLERTKGYTKNDELYCASCYESQFCDQCAKCQKKITVESRHISFRDKNWHDECFTCSKCDTKLSDSQFEFIEDKFLCSDCYQKDYAPKCEGCKETFEPETQIVTYEEKVYHVPCFKCVDCQNSIGTGPFKPHEGRVYCKSCHLRNFGVRCFRCTYSITDDRALMYNKQPYHESCFTCYKCVSNISKRPFKTVDGNWYCFKCYGDTFCQRCHLCEQPILLGSDEDVMYTYQDCRWHATCFTCHLCKNSLADKAFIMRDKLLVCKTCVSENDLKEKAPITEAEAMKGKEVEEKESKEEQAEKSKEAEEKKSKK